MGAARSKLEGVAPVVSPRGSVGSLTLSLPGDGRAHVAWDGVLLPLNAGTGINQEYRSRSSGHCGAAQLLLRGTVLPGHCASASSHGWIGDPPDLAGRLLVGGAMCLV